VWKLILMGDEVSAYYFLSQKNLFGKNGQITVLLKQMFENEKIFKNVKKSQKTINFVHKLQSVNSSELLATLVRY
jgi:hypothetical protein